MVEFVWRESWAIERKLETFGILGLRYASLNLDQCPVHPNAALQTYVFPLEDRRVKLSERKPINSTF